MSIKAIRELETLASVCPELNMANYTEDDVRQLNDWAIEMALLVEKVIATALAQQPATGEPVGGQASSVWNSIQIASWIGSQLMREPSMFERNAVCKFVRSLGRHPTLLKHSPKDTHSATGEPVTAVKSIHVSQGALKCTNGTQNTLLLQQEAAAVGDTKTPENGFQGPLAQDLSTKAGASQVEPFAHICIVNTKDAGPTKFFTAPSDPRAIPVYTHPAPGVPDGYVLVPVEPTDEMMAEMLGPFIAPFIAINDDNRSAFVEAYPRMLTAAQAQKGQP